MNPLGRWLLAVAACLNPRGLRRRGEARRREAGARAERAAELGRTIWEMPEDMRRCFILHYHRGFSVAEVAELMLLPPAAVDAHLEEAQRRLRSWLDDTAP